MKVLNDMPRMNRTGREERYPWSLWLDGKIRLLEAGKDFSVEPRSMRANAYAAARRHGVDITVRTVGDDIAIQAS
ncbi:MAG: hypothetical protein CML19_01585 [Pusillimonas sp.]|nr:hypothetical protein [Pusillimonas sp.]|tara:strand:+ start:236 stop:460 length:225 start_codon:yes stop_codon:yes gene_type:complete